MKYAVDFDGVIIDHQDLPTRKDWWRDEPMPNALNVIKHWLSKGIDVYICTAREPHEWDRVADWLSQHGFPQLRITNIKEKGTKVLIDDKCYRFTNWMDIVKLF